MSTLLPTGGSYWDPRCCWWCTNSWVCTAVTRVYDVVRVALWLIARILDFLGTLIFNVLIPFAQLVFVSALSFINFMVGLLLGEFRMEMTILAPLFLFVGSWLLWLFWPQISCFIDPTLWNIVYDLSRGWARAALFLPTFLNMIIRIWNSLVPIVGFLIYIIIEIVVLTGTFVVELLGEFDVIALFSSVSQIFMLIAEIALNIIIAIVGVITTDLSQFSDAVGPTVAAIVTAAKILIAVTVWVFGALWTLLEPILVTLISVIRFVKNHFFLRSLLSLDEFSTDEDAPPAEKLWQTLGAASTRYWDAESAADGISSLGAINRWHLAHPPSAAVDYYWFHRASYMGGVPGFSSTRVLYGVPSPGGWLNATESAPKSKHAQRLRGNEHLSAMASHMLTRPHATPEDDWTPLHEEVDTHHVECKSHLCGGAGRRLHHPARAIISDRQPHLFDAMGGSHSHRAHRRRFIHTISMVHAVRKAAVHVAHTHWNNGKGVLPGHIERAWTDLTGHASLHSFIEHHTSHHAHPLDSVLSLLPVPSNWTVFRFLRRIDGDDGSDGVYHADWLEGRELFYNSDHTDHKGRPRLYVTQDKVPPPPPPPEGSSHRERRGPFTPDKGANSGASGGIKVKGASNSAIPALPVFELLYTQTCTSKPRNQLCLPEITPQLGCLLESIFLLFPKKPPVQLCDYEQQCADVGFCIVPRPTVGPDIFVVLNNVSSWISWCWLQNGLVWIGVVLSLILPVIRITFQVLAALIPFLAWFFNAFVGIIPELVSTQELVCLIPFFYGFVLWVVILYFIYIFVLPLLFWFWRTIISFDAMLSALRAAEATRLAYLEQGGSRQLIEKFWQVNHNGVLPGDPWMNSPLVTRPPNPNATLDPYNDMRAQAGRLRVFAPPRGGNFMPYIPLTSGYTPDEADLAHVSPLLRPDLELRSAPSFAPVPLVAPISADIEAAQAAHTETVTPEATMAIRVYNDALRHAATMFGPPAGIVSMQDVFSHEGRFRPLIHSAQWSATWLRRYIAEHQHQAAANTMRRPPALFHQRGMFDDSF